MPLDMKNLTNIEFICDIINNQIYKNESNDLSFLNSINDSENLRLFELYIDNIEIMATINDLVCSSNELSYLNAIRNSNLLKNLIIEYIYPILLVIGLFGNMISLITMIRIYQRKKVPKTVAVSLAALACADIFVLVFGCLREWIEIKFNVEIKTINNLSCKIILYLCYVSSSYSAWIHVFITMERCIAIYKPLSIKIICSNGINRISNMSILSLCLIINCPLLCFAELVDKLVFSPESDLGINLTKICQVKEDRGFVNGLILFTDSIFYCLLPFILIFLFSCIAIFKLIQTKSVQSVNVKMVRKFSKNMDTDNFKRHKDSFTSGIESFAICSEIKEINYCANQVWYLKNSTISKANIESNCIRKTYARNKLKRKNKKPNLKTTIMLLSLPICYITTVLPIVILILIGWVDRQMRSKESEDKDETSHYFEIAHSVGSALMYVNSSINILLYILFGKNLRHDFMSVLPCMHLKKKYKNKSGNKLNGHIKSHTEHNASV